MARPSPSCRTFGGCLGRGRTRFGSRCVWSWPRRNTTAPHGDREWQGPGGGGGRYELKYTVVIRMTPPPPPPPSPPPPTHTHKHTHTHPPTTSPPQAAGAVYYEMDTGERRWFRTSRRAASTFVGGAAARGDDSAHGGRLRAGAHPRGAAAGPRPQGLAASPGALPAGAGGALALW